MTTTQLTKKQLNQRKYYRENKDKIVEYRKDYYKRNKAKIQEYQKIYNLKKKQKAKYQNEEHEKIFTVTF